MLTLIRNLGSSIGISIVIAKLTNKTTRCSAAGRIHHAVQRRAEGAGRAVDRNGDR